jgi:hypothetical protein
LKQVLAGGETPVLQIEAEARNAGLLGPDQPISQNKSFRSARDMLGIKPERRGGTGASGQWVWELPINAKMAASLMKTFPTFLDAVQAWTSTFVRMAQCWAIRRGATESILN